MFNILLTDDEQIVIDSLTLILNKNFEGQIKIFSALSGAQALSIVQADKIDIVFMDIHMPGLNGLETISLIKQINPNTVVIILSAYDQFHYAQEAINLGAYKYLTKPVNRNLIVQTVQGAMDLVNSRHGKLSDSIELHEKLNLVTSMVESDFIYSCIFNNASDTDFSDYLEYFSIQNTSYFMCCIEVPNIDSSKRYEIYMKIRDVFSSKCRCILGSFMVNRIGAFFPITKTTDADDLEVTKQNLMNKIYILLTQNLSAKVKIGVSKVHESISETSTAYNDALFALNKIQDESGLSLYYENSNTSSNEVQIQKYVNLILNRIKIGDASSVRQNVSLYMASLCNTYIPQMDKIKGFIFELLVNIRNIVLNADPSYRNEAFDSSFSILSKTDEVSELEEFLLNRCIECAAAMAEISGNQENPIIAKACAYIGDNLEKNISLDQLAEYLGVSPFYLSKLFKEEKGENYISYLTTCRLEKAKRLLQNDSLIIKEITAQTGYNDQNYFSKLFKQKYGMTPSEFRDSIKRGQ